MEHSRIFMNIHDLVNKWNSQTIFTATSKAAELGDESDSKTVGDEFEWVLIGSLAV